jgi:hypothetical protein
MSQQYVNHESSDDYTEGSYDSEDYDEEEPIVSAAAGSRSTTYAPSHPTQYRQYPPQQDDYDSETEEYDDEPAYQLGYQ